MTAIPPDARKVVLAAVVPCDECKGTGCDELTVADYIVTCEECGAAAAVTTAIAPAGFVYPSPAQVERSLRFVRVQCLRFEHHVDEWWTVPTDEVAP